MTEARKTRVRVVHPPWILKSTYGLGFPLAGVRGLSPLALGRPPSECNRRCKQDERLACYRFALPSAPPHVAWWIAIRPHDRLRARVGAPLREADGIHRPDERDQLDPARVRLVRTQRPE